MSLLLQLVAPVDDSDGSPGDTVVRAVSSRPCGATHQHSNACGHVAIEHNGHVDYLVGTELHHHKDDGTCDVHGQLLPSVQSPVQPALIVGSPALRRRGAAGVSCSSTATTLSASSGADAAPAQGHAGLHGWRFIVGFCLSLTFMVVEFVVGHIIGSLALQADAFHMASDVAAMFIGWYAETAAQRTRTARATYGFRRIEIVGALVNCVFLLSISFTILIEALQRLPDYASIAETLGKEVDLLMIVGGVGLGVNILALGVFGSGHGHGHSHGGGHGHSHGQEAHAHAGAVSLNVQGVLAHIIGDAMGSLAVIVSGIAVKFSSSPYRGLADPLTSLAIIALLVAGTLSPLRQCIAILAQTVPSSIDTDALCKDMLAVRDVVAVHDLHAWQLDQRKVIGSVHVLVSRDARSFYAVMDAIKELMHRVGIHSSTVQVEFDSPDAASRCHDVVCGPACEEAQCCPMPPSPIVARDSGDHGHSHGGGAAASHDEHGHDHGGHGHDHGGHGHDHQEHGHDHGGHGHDHGGHGHSHGEP